MKKRLLIFACLITLILSCSPKTIIESSPTVVVLKLLSSESFRDYDIAERYIDVKSVYKESSDPYGAWKKKIDFQHSLGEDKKFSSCFPLHKYLIDEKNIGNEAEVRFIDSTGMLVYKLKKYDSSLFKVYDINYVRK